jgi:hypothetical protein
LTTLPIEPSRASSLALWGELAAILAVLLPAIGVGMRIVAFAPEHRFVVSLASLASAQPIGALVVLGLQGIIPTGLAFVLFYFFLYSSNRKSSEPDTKRDSLSGAELATPEAQAKPLAGKEVGAAGDATGARAGFPPSWVKVGGLILVGIAGVIYLITVPSWPLLLVAIPTGLGTLVVLEYLKRHDLLSLSKAWILLIPAVLVGGPTTGFAIVRLPSGYVTFAKSGQSTTDVGLRNGNYSIVGMDGNSYYLLPCSSTGRLLSVTNSSIASIAYYKPPHQPTLTIYGMVFEHRTGSLAAITFSCPGQPGR